MKFVPIANEGGLLPGPIVRDSFELRPAERREVVVDFTRYMDGTPTKPGDELYLVDVMKMTGAVWRIRDGGGSTRSTSTWRSTGGRRNGRPAADTRHTAGSGKEDVVAPDPSEEVVICRRFRTFTGPHVAQCHNLAHEDHNVMFGWEILP